ncbi:3-hydroxyacyl-CoA dehydrogenase NAD-binding domain-containing protein [Streptomyces sp. NPDC002765]|uniref:3-hydroxyacyl-CoA dehydrogenase NAD-binding domain-containing protein n=1 Tax=Streptomyces sp. C1-1 TaxID=3231173 RepID=UPI003D01C6FF
MTPRAVPLALAEGRTTQEASDALLGRIRTTADAADFTGVDLVIEAVFESAPLKQRRGLRRAVPAVRLAGGARRAR